MDLRPATRRLAWIQPVCLSINAVLALKGLRILTWQWVRHPSSVLSTTPAVSSDDWSESEQTLSDTTFYLLIPICLSNNSFDLGSFSSSISVNLQTGYSQDQVLYMILPYVWSWLKHVCLQYCILYLNEFLSKANPQYSTELKY